MVFQFVGSQPKDGVLIRLHLHPSSYLAIASYLFIYLFIYLIVFLGLHQWHMEVSRLGVESEL